MTDFECKLDLTFRGVELRDDTFHYVKHCSRSALAALGLRDRRVQVLLERERLADRVRAYVAVDDGPTTLRARGADADELIAVRNAFARLEIHRAHAS